MTNPIDSQYRSFLVRIWREQDAAGAAGWQGEIEHIQWRRRWHFTTMDELLAFLRGQAEDPGLMDAGPLQDEG